jgi:hypothetical protein
LLGRIVDADGADRPLATDHDRRLGGSIGFVRINAARRSRGVLPMHA